ncbi:hypothetical protein MRB53_037719 [Persea americana]|nr:hypothetical protein MRB53_037719 [Persea americana]
MHHEREPSLVKPRLPMFGSLLHELRAIFQPPRRALPLQFGEAFDGPLGPDSIAPAVPSDVAHRGVNISSFAITETPTASSDVSSIRGAMMQMHAASGHSVLVPQQRSSGCRLLRTQAISAESADAE